MKDKGWLPIEEFNPEDAPFLAFVWDGSTVTLAYYDDSIGAWVSDDGREQELNPLKYIPIEFPEPPEES